MEMGVHCVRYEVSDVSYPQADIDRIKRRVQQRLNPFNPQINMKRLELLLKEKSDFCEVKWNIRVYPSGKVDNIQLDMSMNYGIPVYDEYVTRHLLTCFDHMTFPSLSQSGSYPISFSFIKTRRGGNAPQRLEEKTGHTAQKDTTTKSRRLRGQEAERSEALISAVRALRSGKNICEYHGSFRRKEPLIYAAVRSGNLDRVKESLEKGETLDWEQRCRWGHQNLVDAASRTSLSVLEYLFRNNLTGEMKGVDHEPLRVLVADNGWPETLRWLLKNGLDVNTRDRDGNTLLLRAVQVGYVENVKILLNHGADPLVRNDRGENAMMNIRRCPPQDSTALVSLLTKAGCTGWSGKGLPPACSAFADGREQRDNTGRMYKMFPFINKGLRFFIVHDSIHHPRIQKIPQRSEPVTGDLYMVRSDQSCTRITNTKELSSLGLRVKSEQEAVNIVLAYMNTFLISGHSGIDLRFEKPNFRPFPKAGCFVYSTIANQLNISGKIEVSAFHGGYEVALWVIFDVDFRNIRIPVPEVGKAKYRIYEDGDCSYSLTRIATPDLWIERRCFER